MDKSALSVMIAIQCATIDTDAIEGVNHDK